MEEEHRRPRRDTFLSDAADYVDARPGYPPLLMLEAAALAELKAAAVLLEVGCGTGEATIWFARQGYRMLALDRSDEMLQLAAQRLQEFPNVELRRQDFEDAPPAMRFDALLFATSFHWLDPKTRIQRCLDALEPAGSLILLWHTHMPPSGSRTLSLPPPQPRYLHH